MGAPSEDSSATGIGGSQANARFPSVYSSGAVYVFARDETAEWSQQAYIKASNPSAADSLGTWGVALSEDGNTLAVGASYEDGHAIGIGGDQASSAASNAGAAYLFVLDDLGAWSQQAYVKASNTDADDPFGRSIALSGDGNTAVGAHGEDGNGSGIGGDQGDDSAAGAGAVYLY